MKKLFFHLVLPASFFLFTFHFMPIGEVFQFDPNDEGIELIKAVLYSGKFRLYTQIYNDQPPLSTIILSSWLQVFGKSILAARLLTLSFATLLVWSFCQILRLQVGTGPAIVGTILLIVSCNFLRLSVSVMFGLPALALALLSVYIYLCYKQHPKRSVLIASGALLALSLQIKLFTVLLIPLIILDFIQFWLTQPKQERSRPAISLDIITWLASLILTFTIVGICSGSLTYEQLVNSHFSYAVKNNFNPVASYQLLAAFLIQDFDYLLLAILGIFAFRKIKITQLLLPLMWMVFAWVLLLQHRPVWYHHYLLISLPLTWLMTHGIVLSLQAFQKRKLSFSSRLREPILVKLAAGCLIFSLLLVPVKLKITKVENQVVLAQTPEHFRLVNLLLTHRESTRWIFTDCPMYAFYANLKVPPEIAVLSFIRIQSDTFTQQQLLEVFETYRPEQVLLCKSPKVQNYVNTYLGQHYIKTYMDDTRNVYYLKHSD